MSWLWERIKGAFNSAVERVLWLGVVVVGVLIWRFHSADVNVPAWLLVWAIGLPFAFSLRLLWLGHRQRALSSDLQAEVDLGTYYARHLYDALGTLQKVLMGAIPGVTIETFIEQGILQPAREFLMQRPGEEVRLSVLVPDESNHWRMAFAAGFRLESRQRFSLPIVGSFSRYAYESGEMQWSFDLQTDPRYTPHPEATHEYQSIISVPIRVGDDPIAVFNVDSNLGYAFPQADFVYIILLGAIISVVWALGGYDEAQEAEGGNGGPNANESIDRNVE